mmetsp:Transcript_71801/g.171568  ORF Transcript_71801/g.171568 Transcript_71801/m.171568 type:complete len:102 (+) Transcript_71801:136-441(+)|eukprot:CAMPEP_0181409172 /NCGR_PEP_ID=MMETSP1110-20121109/6679_1 /TAXON_ID=174948 /ORGANISM="Symbiodinium sp., Strain CCMP421" /LENGTH=101 /DNA_ID=CAMNT_0023531665 /DNA_START=348 /DNA_END=653 /DNA_ORIENTATION=-
MKVALALEGLQLEWRIVKLQRLSVKRWEGQRHHPTPPLWSFQALRQESTPTRDEGTDRGIIYRIPFHAQPDRWLLLRQPCPFSFDGLHQAMEAIRGNTVVR